MICQIYRPLNCKGCPEYDKDYCQGVKKGMKQIRKIYREDAHRQNNYATKMAILPIISESDSPQLTARDILNKVEQEKRSRRRIKLWYVHEVMQRMYKHKKIDGKIYYFAKFVEPLY